MILPNKTVEQEILRTLKSLGFDGRKQNWLHGTVRMLHAASGAGKAIVVIVPVYESATWDHQVAEIFKRVEAISQSYVHSEVAICVFVERGLPHECVLRIEEHDFDFPVEIYRVGEDVVSPLMGPSLSKVGSNSGDISENVGAKLSVAVQENGLSQSKEIVKNEDELLGKSGHEILDLVQTHLVDLTRRSSLLHFSTGKDNVRVVQERANDLYELLVVKERVIRAYAYGYANVSVFCVSTAIKES